MIVCNKELLRERCYSRGYSLEEVMPCVVAQNGDEWTIDVDHHAYPRADKQPDASSELPPPPPLVGGPGTELSKLLKRFGIEATPTCKCRAKAAEMDAWGCDEAGKPERIEEVVAVMREEAKARGLPFIDAVGKMLVKRAIHNARKATIR